MSKITRCHYKTVSANSEDTNDYTVPNGNNLELTRVGGSAVHIPDVHVKVVWDPGGDQEKIINCTHGDQYVDCVSCSLPGNGSRVIRISLKNDSDVSETIGAFWIGDLT